MFRQSLTIALMTTALAAQGPTFDVTAGGSLALDGLKKVTHSSTAYHLGGGMKWLFKATDTPLRLGFTYHDMPGSQFGPADRPLRSSLKAYQLHLDAYLASGSPRYAFKFGISANRYTLKNRGEETWGADPMLPPLEWLPGTVPIGTFAVEDARGVKLGLRLGVDFHFNRHWGGEILLQATELSGGKVKDLTVKVPDELAPYIGDTVTVKRPTGGPVNPSWIQVGVRYSF